MGKKSQCKGRSAELELSRLLQGYGYDVMPGRAVSYGSTPDISGLSGVHIECKRAEQLRIQDWKCTKKYRKVPHKKGRITRQKAAETDERKG